MNIMERNASAYIVFALTGQGGENIDRVIEVLEAKDFKTRNPMLNLIRGLRNYKSKRTIGAVQKRINKWMAEQDGAIVK